VYAHTQDYLREDGKTRGGGYGSIKCSSCSLLAMVFCTLLITSTMEILPVQAQIQTKQPATITFRSRWVDYVVDIWHIHSPIKYPAANESAVLV
jgi:hypothetical protein